MRGYFDNDEPEVEEQEERRHDTEVTLSTAAQLGIVFCLLLMCGLCFGLGYWVGHKPSASAPTTAATQPTAPTAAPDQEPLQGNGTLPKPSADAQVPPTQPPPESDGTTPAPASNTSPAPTPPQQALAATPPSHTPASSPSPKPAAPASPTPASAPRSTPVQPPVPTRTNEPRNEQTAPAMRPANPSATSGYMVQIAAVLHAEDANVLVNALRNRGFAATAQRMPSDGLVHVRIGPFATHEEASRMSMRLLGDGYNAMVQP
ncbi:MAG: SPOR domain-containing protein [Terracidiphilus sp.]